MNKSLHLLNDSNLYIFVRLILRLPDKPERCRLVKIHSHHHLCLQHYARCANALL